MNENSASEKTNTVSADFLIEGSVKLAGMQDFKYIGRDDVRRNIASALMRKNNNNLLLSAQTGVGFTSTIMSLQAGKLDGTMPIDIIGKKFYWLDTDSIFESGDPRIIRQNFDKAMATLQRAPDTVLVLDDVKSFVDGARHNGVISIFNTLMNALKGPDLQAIVNGNPDSIKTLSEAHPGFEDMFLVQPIREPTPEELKDILNHELPLLAKYHGIEIGPDVVHTMVDLSIKYPAVLQKEMAQPKRSLVIAEMALTAMRFQEHIKPSEVIKLEKELKTIVDTLDNPNVAPPELQGKPVQYLEEKKTSIEDQLKSRKDTWDKILSEIKLNYEQLQKREGQLRERTREIAIKEKAIMEKVQKKLDEAHKSGDPKKIEDAQRTAAMAANASELVDAQEARKSIINSIDKDIKPKFQAIVTRMNQGLMLNAEDILNVYSAQTGFPLSQLNEDKTEKLLKIEENVEKRVFGQAEAIEAMADSVRQGETGFKKPDEPVGVYLLIGAPGVGKTELAKAFAEYLFGSEDAMNRFDMTNYQEKTSISAMLGANPGYEGYAEGGELTNAIRAKPNSVLLLDEIEKAYPKIYDIFLRAFTDGIITDTKHVPASLGGTLVIMTSNIGARHFTNPDLSREEIVDLVKKDLTAPKDDNGGGGGGLRPEFVDRVKVIFMNDLTMEVLKKIAKKKIDELNSFPAAKKRGLKIEMDKDAISDMCEDSCKGARSGRIVNTYIKENVTKQVVRSILKNKAEKGVLKMTYNAAAENPRDKVAIEFIPNAATTTTQATAPAQAANR